MLALTDDQKTAFFTDGYLVIKNLLSQGEIETLRERYAALVTGGVPAYPQRHVSVRNAVGRADFGCVQGMPDADGAVRIQTPQVEAISFTRSSGRAPL